jgi:hypothetical protein
MRTANKKAASDLAASTDYQIRGLFGRSGPRVSSQRVPYFASSISVGRHSFVKNGSSGL